MTGNNYKPVDIYLRQLDNALMRAQRVVDEIVQERRVASQLADEDWNDLPYKLVIQRLLRDSPEGLTVAEICRRVLYARKRLKRRNVVEKTLYDHPDLFVAIEPGIWKLVP